MKKDKLNKLEKIDENEILINDFINFYSFLNFQLDLLKTNIVVVLNNVDKNKEEISKIKIEKEEIIKKLNDLGKVLLKNLDIKKIP